MTLVGVAEHHPSAPLIRITGNEVFDVLDLGLFDAEDDINRR